MKWIRYFLLSFVAGLSLQVAAQDPAHKANAITFSNSYKQFSLQSAYRLQKAYVRNQVSRGVTMIGFKLDLTTSEGQKHYQLNEPITGVLIEPPLTGKHIVLNSNQAKHLMIRQGLAFQLSKAIKEPVTSLEQLQTIIKHVAPAIELPDFNFVDEHFNGLDMIANNAMANQIILGRWQSAKNVDAIAMSLKCQGALVHQSDNSQVMQGQWQTLLWMVNHLLEQGYMLRTGQVLFTGTVSPMVSAQACDYTADFSALGTIQFTVQ